MRTKAVTEGAMLATIIVLLSLLNSIFGLFGFLIPIPIAFLVYRHNLKVGAIVSLVGAILVALVLMSPLFGLDLIITSIVGIALGLGLKENFKFTSLFLVGIGASIIAALLKMSTFSAISGFNIIDTYLEVIEDASRQTISLLESLGTSEQFLAQYAQELSVLPTLFQLLVPLLLLGLGIFESIVALFLLNIVLGRFNITVPKAPPFIEWKWPWYFVWGFIFSKAIVILLQYYSSDVLRMIALNCDYFFSVAFLIQGMALAWSFLTKAGITKLLKIIFVMFLLISGNFLIYYFLIMFGVLDTWFDFRKLSKEEI